MEECICKHPSVISENGNELLFDKEGNLIKELPKKDVDKLGYEDVPKLGYDVEKLARQSWEGCDGCTEQDEVMYKNGYVKGYNAAIAELPKELSDEEIEKAAWKYVYDNKMDANNIVHYIRACKWYREQLKSKQ
jgi:hypothetical protein